MPVSVPTAEEFVALQAYTTSLADELAALQLRVEKLEQDAATPPPIDPRPDGYLSAEVFIGGTSYLFHEGDAKDLGNYIPPSGAFTMQCRREVIAGCPLRVDFRRIDGWSSVVFELGDVFEAPVDLANGYSVEITDERGERHIIDIKTHWSLCRWRWQSGAWPHHRSAAEMVANRELPAFDAARAVGSQSLGPAVYQPLGFAGFEPRMPNTGGRNDIGQVTEYQGWALCTNDPAAWDSVMAQGEAMNSWPFMMRDGQTGAPMDPLAYPHASYYQDHSTDPLLYSSPGAHAANIIIDPHHQPAGAYVPYLRTEDPYFLEVLQCQTVRNFCDLPRSSPQMPGSDQVRGTAWSLRTMVQGWHVTPETVPSWLLPKTTMKALLDQGITVLDSVIAQNDVLRSVFHLADFWLNYSGNTPTGTCCGIWQDDFAIGASAWAAVLHPPAAKFAAYMAHNALDRLGGTSGWAAGVPETYSLQVRDVPDGPYYPSWTKCWQVNAPQLGLDPNNPPMQLHYSNANEFDYPNGLLAALGMVEQARAHGVDLPDCSKILRFLSDALTDGAHRVPGGSIYWRSAMAH